MRTKFDAQLERLNEELTRMGALCEQGINAAIAALVDGDAAKANEAISIDGDIDRMEREIEDICLRLLLRQQPVARDLRQISAALKMITDMERIGDQTTDISEIVLLLMGTGYTQQLDHLGEMAKATAKMVTGSVDAFVRQDLELARRVVEYDDVVDDLFRKSRQDLIDRIQKESGCGEQAIDFLMIAKYFERIGDHATNIAEWVAFSITGRHGCFGTSPEGEAKRRDSEK